jgi:hypothetical protein
LVYVIGGGRPDLVDQATAEQDVKAFARAEQAKLDSQ